MEFFTLSRVGGVILKNDIMKSLFLFVVHGIFFVIGYLYFIFQGKNTNRGHQAMVFLFCNTGGQFNDMLLRLERWRCRKFLVDLEGQGVLGSVNDMRGIAVDQLKNLGYHANPKALSEDVCDRLMAFALKTPALVRPMDGQEKKSALALEVVNLNNPGAVRYDYRTEDLLSNPDIQDLVADPSLLALAEAYLGKLPKLDVMSMWWHFGYHDQPDSEAAQLYHFDLDRPKWLKVFIYLTDVGPENGPHYFIQGSHRVNGIPQSFLRRGYVRLTDEEVLNAYGADQQIVFMGERGSIIVEDTMGLHKGGVVKGGGRLMLQLQFSSSLFGANYPKATLPSKKTGRLQERASCNSEIYSGYL